MKYEFGSFEKFNRIQVGLTIVLINLTDILEKPDRFRYVHNIGIGFEGNCGLQQINLQKARPK